MKIRFSIALDIRRELKDEPVQHEHRDTDSTTERYIEEPGIGFEPEERKR